MVRQGRTDSRRCAPRPRRARVPAKVGDGFALICGESTLFAETVVAATGAYHTPRVPPFACELDGSIVQLHSKAYRKRSQIQEGGVLVVGAGNSGAEIAIELAADHQTWLSGRDPGQEPTRAGSLPDHLFTPIMWFMATRVLTVKMRFGRKVRDHYFDPPRGIPLRFDGETRQLVVTKR